MFRRILAIVLAALVFAGCGAAPTTPQILAALATEPEIAYLELGNIREQARDVGAGVGNGLPGLQTRKRLVAEVADEYFLPIEA